MFAIVTSVGVIGVLIVGRIFGHAELSLVFKRLSALGSSLTNFPSWKNGRGYEAHLQGVLDWSKLWADLHSRFEEFSLKSVQLDVNVPAVHENYHASWNQPLPTDDQDSASTWRAEIPLTLRGRAFGRLSLSGCRDGRPEWQKIALLVQLSEEFAASNHLYNGVAVDLAHAKPLPAPRRTKFGEPKPVATVGN
jgi:UDP-GlcNAc:undecaprenyl-phosphate GlcNAc-1-phosphate transferase